MLEQCLSLISEFLTIFLNLCEALERNRRLFALIRVKISDSLIVTVTPSIMQLSILVFDHEQWEYNLSGT